MHRYKVQFPTRFNVIGGDRSNLILSMQSELIAAKERGTLASNLLGFELTKEEIASISSIESDEYRTYQNAISKILDNRTNTGWTTSGHTGVDVQIFAKGLGSEHFRGHLDNTQIAQTIFELLRNKK